MKACKKDDFKTFIGQTQAFLYFLIIYLKCIKVL